MAVDIHNLGSFATVADVYKKYPDGGSVGDYFTLEGDTATKYYWNPVYRTWGVEDAPAPPTPEVEAGAIINMDARYPLETGYYQISDEEAPNYAPSVVPANLRVKSLILTFLEGVESPAAYQFIDASIGYFTDKNSWKKLAYLSDVPTESTIQQKIDLSSSVWNASSEGAATNLAAATDACPAEVRKMGLNIILKNSAGKWEAWQFIGTNILAQFEVTTYWQKIYTAQSDFLNLTEQVPPTEGYYMLFSGSPGQIAVNHVPDDYRYPGVVITFFSGVVWELWQFIGTDAAEQWTNPSYWLERSNYTLTKAAIEEHLTGHIISHTHGITNLTPSGTVTLLLDAINAVPAPNRVYGHMVTFKDEVYGWQLWRFIGTNIATQFANEDYWERIDIPEDTTGKTVIDAGAQILPYDEFNIGIFVLDILDPEINPLQYIHIPADYKDDFEVVYPVTISLSFKDTHGVNPGSSMIRFEIIISVLSADTPALTLNVFPNSYPGKTLTLTPVATLPATLAKGLHHFTFIRDMSELENVNLYVEHTYTAAS